MKAYILGGTQSDFKRNLKREGKDAISLLRDVLNESLKDCDISFNDILKLNKENRIEAFVGSFIPELYIAQGHIGALISMIDEIFVGMPIARYEDACASSSVALDTAISKIRLGDIDMAIVIGFEIMKGVDSKICGDILGYASYREKEAIAIDYPFPKLFSKLADYTISKYHFDEKKYMNALSMISFNNLMNAKRNPFAQTRDWEIKKDVISDRGSVLNPYVSDRLSKYDCSQVTDGAVYMILVSQDYAKSKGLNHLPFVKGWGHRNADFMLDDKIKRSTNDEYLLPYTKMCIDECLKRAELDIKDIGVYEVHDCFTSSEFIEISHLGLCKPKETIDYIESGNIAITSATPINPSGGLIGAGHPVGASGLRMLLDVYKQVLGKAGEYQVYKNNETPKYGMTLNIGGTMTTNYSFIVSA